MSDKMYKLHSYYTQLQQKESVSSIKHNTKYFITSLANDYNPENPLVLTIGILKPGGALSGTLYVTGSP